MNGHLRRVASRRNEPSRCVLPLPPAPTTTQPSGEPPPGVRAMASSLRANAARSLACRPGTSEAGLLQTSLSSTAQLKSAAWIASSSVMIPALPGK